MQRIPSDGACWPVGIHRFDYEEGQRCFSSLSHKGGLVPHQDNGTSKSHVKLTLLWPIIPTFDLTNVFVPPSTSANTSTSLTISPALPLPDTAPARLTRLMRAGGKRNYLDGEGGKITRHVGGKMLGMQISLAVWLLLFELK